MFDEYWVDPVALTRANVDHAVGPEPRGDENTEVWFITPREGGFSVGLRLELRMALSKRCGRGWW
jgi:hypothetical protein